VDGQVVAAFRLDGHEVLHVVELDPGIDDFSVLEQSVSAGTILLTADRDFGEIVFRQRRSPAGVLLLRLAGAAPEERASLVRTMVRQHGSVLAGALSVLGRGSLRIRRQAR
jgi:predicted nuclease of predicted toxin-antitoxin system